MSYWMLDAVRPGPIEASHRWLMPGMDCSVCNRVWASDGAALPTVNLEGHPADSRLRKPPYPVPLADWRRLVEQIRSVVLASEPIRPGLDPGTIAGAQRLSVSGYILHGLGIVLSEEVRDEFASLAPDIPLVRADLRGNKLPPCYELGRSLRIQPIQVES